MTISYFSPAQQRVLAKAILRLFDLWSISNTDRASALGLAEIDVKTLAEMDAPTLFAAERHVFERACALLRIHQLLDSLFPAEAAFHAKWMTSPHRKFDGLSPLQTIQQGGIEGARRVLSVLEQQFR
jgi:hypothetical protein